MKTFLGVLVGLFALMSIVTMTLLLTGHIGIEPHHLITNVVDDKGKVLFELSDQITGYRIVFVK